MKIFVQAAQLDQIRGCVDSGLADGIVLSPIDLADDDPSATMADRIAELDRELALPMCVPVAAVTGDDIYRDGRDLARASERVIVQIPLVEDAIAPVRRLVADGIQVCATHVYTGTQAFLAAKIGASMVSVEAYDLDAYGQHAAAVVAQIRDVLDMAELECDLSVTPSPGAASFADHLLAGADIACVTPAALNRLMIHALTDRGVDRFLSALSKRHKPRSL